MPESITITSAQLLQQAKYQLQLPTLVEQVLHRQIILQTVEREGIVVSTEELQTAADQLRVTHQLLTARHTLDWLERHRLSIEDFEDLAYTQLIRKKLADRLCSPQIPAYFAERQLDYAQAVIYAVTIATEALAMELFYSLQAQEQDFLAIVHRYVTDPVARQRGEYRRTVRRRDLDPEISAAVFAVQPPTVLRPQATRSGYQLLYVAAILPPELTAPLEAQIRDELFYQWLCRQAADWEVVWPRESESAPPLPSTT
jgi:parvulin-like peptidyl-prolyl isomerase